MSTHQRKAATVEPLSNDHPHQRPSLLYDHILFDGQCFLFVRSLTNDHPSDATNDRVRWDFLPRERPLRVQESRVAVQHPFPMVYYYNVVPRHLSSNSELSFILAKTLQRRFQIDVASLRCCQPSGAQTHL